MYELYARLELLRNKAVRTDDEELEYEQLRSRYNKLYREYSGKYALIMAEDKKESAIEKKPRISKRFRTLLICLGAAILFVGFVVAYDAINKKEENSNMDLTKDYVEWEGESGAGSNGYMVVKEENDDNDAELLEVDERVPDLTKAENTNQKPERKHFVWTAQDGTTALSWSPQLYKETYEAYRAAARYYDSDEFYHYISDVHNENILLEISGVLESIGDGMGYSRWELANEAKNFVQCIPYTEDMESAGEDEWPKYVIETIYDECGDCEDKAFLLAGILKNMGFDAVLVVFDGHIGVGIGIDEKLGINASGIQQDSGTGIDEKLGINASGPETTAKAGAGSDKGPGTGSNSNPDLDSGSEAELELDSESESGSKSESESKSDEPKILEFGNKKYYYIEPSFPGWEIGRLPDNVNSAKAVFVPLSGEDSGT